MRTNILNCDLITSYEKGITVVHLDSQRRLLCVILAGTALGETLRPNPRQVNVNQGTFVLREVPIKHHVLRGCIVMHMNSLVLLVTVLLDITALLGQQLPRQRTALKVCEIVKTLSTLSFPIGNLCPSGQYCISGSSSGANCPPGTYFNVTGGQSVSDCIHCPPGEYCAGFGNALPSGLCTAGYYCPTGMLEAAPPAYPCPIGS